MRKQLLSIVLGLLFIYPAMAFGYGHYNISSGVPAHVYIDNVYRATISDTETLKLILPGPQSYVIGVRDLATGQTYKEAVIVGANLNEHRDINAFSNQKANPELSKHPKQAEITIYSKIPAEVFVDTVLMGSVEAAQPMAINLAGPRKYAFEVRAKDSNLIYREEFNVVYNSGLKKEIRAFSDSPTQTISAPATEEPVATVVPVAPVAPAATGAVSREEMSDAIQKATAKAKADALAEEAARRKRADKRALTNTGIAHVLGVEANKDLPSSVKNMERIKLLLEGIPKVTK